MDMEGVQSYIPNRLRKHRRLQGYRQRDVARLLGHSNTRRISMWEKGLAFPNVMNLFKLSIIYRTLPNELYFDLMPELKSFITAQEQLVFNRQ